MVFHTLNLRSIQRQRAVKQALSLFGEEKEGEVVTVVVVNKEGYHARGSVNHRKTSFKTVPGRQSGPVYCSGSCKKMVRIPDITARHRRRTLHRSQKMQQRWCWNTPWKSRAPCSDKRSRYVLSPTIRSWEHSDKCAGQSERRCDHPGSCIHISRFRGGSALRMRVK